MVSLRDSFKKYVRELKELGIECAERDVNYLICTALSIETKEIIHLL